LTAFADSVVAQEHVQVSTALASHRPARLSHSVDFDLFDMLAAVIGLVRQNAAMVFAAELQRVAVEPDMKSSFLSG
jgi:hypothetical protein